MARKPSFNQTFVVRAVQEAVRVELAKARSVIEPGRSDAALPRLQRRKSSVSMRDLALCRALFRLHPSIDADGAAAGSGATRVGEKGDETFDDDELGEEGGAAEAGKQIADRLRRACISRDPDGDLTGRVFARQQEEASSGSAPNVNARGTTTSVVLMTLEGADSTVRGFVKHLRGFPMEFGRLEVLLETRATSRLIQGRRGISLATTQDWNDMVWHASAVAAFQGALGQDALSRLVAGGGRGGEGQGNVVGRLMAGQSSLRDAALTGGMRSTL